MKAIEAIDWTAELSQKDSDDLLARTKTPSGKKLSKQYAKGIALVKTLGVTKVAANGILGDVATNEFNAKVEQCQAQLNTIIQAVAVSAAIQGMIRTYDPAHNSRRDLLPGAKSMIKELHADAEFKLPVAFEKALNNLISDSASSSSSSGAGLEAKKVAKTGKSEAKVDKGEKPSKAKAAAKTKVKAKTQKM